MPHRAIVSQQLADLLGVLSHPQRVRIVEELRDGEQNVNALQQQLGISHSGVSQHLAVLRGRRLVVERREGRHVYYRLRQPQLARWLAEAMDLLLADVRATQSLEDAIDHARAEWATKS